MNEDTARFCTWQSVASVSCSDTLRREDLSLVKLARLIQKREETVTVYNQNLLVRELMKIATKNAELFQRLDFDGLLPLHVAMENELPLEMIKILAEAYPRGVIMLYNPYQDGREWRQSVIRSARTVETLEYLLDQAIRYLHSTLSSGWDEIQMFFAFHYNMVDVIQRLVEEFPDFVKQTGHFHYALHEGTKLPLHFAVQNSAPMAILELLVSSYPQALTTRDYDGSTPLHIACQLGYVSPNIVQLLASSKSLRVVDKDGSLPLHMYCDQQTEDAILNLQVVELMVERFHKSARKLNRDGRTPLHLVCQGPDVENLPVIRFLAQAYPRNLTIPDSTGCTPLVVACQWAGEESLPVVQYLVEASPQSVQRLDAFGMTVLHRYCHSAHPVRLSIIQSLVNAYPDALMIRDKIRRLTPLDIACGEGGDLDVIRFMVEQCPEVLESDGNDDDNSGTPLHTVCLQAGQPYLPGGCRFGRSPRVLTAILQILAISEKAVEAKDSLGRTPLHLLSSTGASRDLLQVIIERSPTVVAKARDGDGRIPLHAAIEGFANHCTTPEDRAFYEETVRSLLELYPLGVHATDNNGMTPLMLACEKNVSLSVIYQLVKVDPLSSRGLEWSQVPCECKDESSTISRWNEILLVVGDLLLPG